jgi:hypothetical protein
MAKAWVIHLGPWWWQSPTVGMAPGTEHTWSWGIPWEWRWHEAVLDATAHPHWGEIERIPGRLAVTRIESERFPNGGIGVHIRVRNTGTQTLHTYRLYVSVIRDASLQPPS